MQNLIHGLTALGNGQSIAYLFGGALIGMVIGVIPGLSTVVILSIILIFLYHVDVTGTLCLFLGAQCGSFYSASVSAILLNTPAHPEAFPITFDGYPMARKGQPGRALGLSACSTCIGGFIGCGVLIGFLQVINYLPGVFHPPEYLALVTLAMLLVGTLGTNSVGKAVIAAGAGLMVASIGPSSITGTFRYTFGAIGLFGGISIVALALGVFAIPQMVMVFGTGTAASRQDMSGQELGDVEAVQISHGYGKELLGGVLETFRHWGVLIQSGLVGGLSGIIPGIGGFTGNFLAYGIAKQTSRNRDQFGTGIPDGIIAPEGSSLAKEAGHIIPIIGLGIPGGVSGALFIAALAIKNMKVGYGFQNAFPNITGEIVWIIAFSGLIGTVAGVLIGPQIARITRVPGPLIVPFIFALSIGGPYLATTQFFGVMELLAFGVIGLGLRRLRYPLGSFILGLVLGPTFETNIYLTRHIYPGLSLVTRRPLADGIFLIAIAVLASKAYEIHREAKRTKSKLAEEIAQLSDETMRTQVVREQQIRRAPYPLLAVVMSTFLLATALYFIIFGATHYGFTTASMPVFGGICVAIPTTMFLPRDVYRYVLYRKARPAMSGPVNPLAGHDRATAQIASVAVIDSIDGSSAVSNESAMSRDRSWDRFGQYRRELIAFGWLFGLAGLCWLFAFPIGIAIFMVGYGLTSTRRYLKRVHSRLIFAALSAITMWFVSYEMFHLTFINFTPRIRF